MGRIRILTDKVANQIAAGEVVERPASVCKELIENALDAAASQVRIDLKAGGRSLIQVTDDGTGMSRDDAMLAFERHATSKLRQAEDLLSIGTLGFRGEALPSIASVARVTLRTRAADEAAGTVVEVRGGGMRDVRVEALAPGTSVAVRDLFYNVPARRKFLRSVKTELAHVVRVATHYSLAHLDKSLRLRNEHGALLDVTPVETARERVYQVFGGDTLARLVEIEPVERASFRLSGFASEPQAQRLNRNSIFIFANRRLVRDSLIQRAIAGAYENLMPKGAYPFSLLFLELPPEEVDVNVHPAKTEVRFRDPGAVFAFVRDSIRARLIETKPAAPLPLPARATPQELGSVPGGAEAPPAPREADRPSAPAPEPAPAGARRFDFAGGQEFAPRVALPPAVRPSAENAAPAGSGLPQAAQDADSGHSRAPLVDLEPTSLVDLSGLQLLGQLHQSFIVAAGNDGLWIIDQHVAHERILFEKVLAARLRGQVPMQRLLMPVVLTLTPSQSIAYDELAEEFGANGFEIEPFGGRAIAVKAAPSELLPGQVEALLRELLDDPQAEMRSLTLADLRKRLAATVACHAAIKINMPLETEKMRWLLEELARSDCPMSCPHGRPIALKYSTREILKAFHRL